jgi:hypothetical protein
MAIAGNSPPDFVTSCVAFVTFVFAVPQFDPIPASTLELLGLSVLSILV